MSRVSQSESCLCFGHNIECFGHNIEHISCPVTANKELVSKRFDRKREKRKFNVQLKRSFGRPNKIKIPRTLGVDRTVKNGTYFCFLWALSISITKQ